MNHELRSADLTIKIKEHGAEMFSVINKNGLEYIWQAKKEVWPRHAPVLFPIVGKLKNNTFKSGGDSYQLGQHGFARDMNFTVTEQTDKKCVLVLNSTSETRKNYPFDFCLRIIYELSGNKLDTKYEIENTGRGNMFFSIGAHPGFRCPLLPEERFEDYYLDFGHDTFLQTVLRDGLRSTSNKVVPLVGKKLYLTSTLFDEDALVFENHQISKIGLCSAKSGHKIEMECDSWPYFGIWSKKGCTEFVCLEPWYGITDSINSEGDLTHKDGIIELEAGQKFSCRFLTTFS